MTAQTIMLNDTPRERTVKAINTLVKNGSAITVRSVREEAQVANALVIPIVKEWKRNHPEYVDVQEQECLKGRPTRTQVLERENAALKAEVLSLRARLDRYERADRQE